MEITTRIFGTIDIAEDKILHMVNGIIGFPHLQQFTLLHDAEQEDSSIKWLQSLDEPNFAIPVIDPLLVRPDYHPEMTPTSIEQIGNPADEDVLVLTTITVPSDLTQMSVNLMGPFVINVKDNKAIQVILEDDEYPVKYMVYDILKQKQASKE